MYVFPNLGRDLTFRQHLHHFRLRSRDLTHIRAGTEIRHDDRADDLGQLAMIVRQRFPRRIQLVGHVYKRVVCDQQQLG
jgi:hypothetical protein